MKNIDSRIGQLTRDGRTVYYINPVDPRKGDIIEGSIQSLTAQLRERDGLSKTHIIAAKRVDEGGAMAGYKADPEDLEIIVKGTQVRAFGIGFVDRGRKEFQGPMFDNVGFLFGLCTVITAWKQTPKPQITVEVGDRIEFAGRTWRVIHEGWNNSHATIEEVL